MLFDALTEERVPVTITASGDCKVVLRAVCAQPARGGSMPDARLNGTATRLFHWMMEDEILIAFYQSFIKIL
ncbi:hypothetical protein AA14337_1708 [Acetobacter malorum DSM 14337]|uniref:Uncharacterized protein n=1 Tax=Acetobacter malorum DSM 14337 TaxID=1307910 RepID=A0ABQ0PT62_9PROT|nr:hypothetical protein [Acetobacter malorum]GBQ80358.1 hypothetical protein AA14337_1708 [Acetobacter malorum DSM 14337]